MAARIKRVVKNQQKLKDKKMKSKDKIFRDTMRIILSVPGTGTNN